MRLQPSDPDIETIVSRIRKGDLDLQPNFQRGEVWSDTKKQRLIDSILRGWHVPPIHVVSDENTRQLLVLDGQQRLASIRDFVDGELRVHGHFEPLSEDLAQIHGLRHADLPETWRRQFDQFSIRQFTILDYKPAEPAELFFRLNQPTSLTAAEQRNAFFGAARAQVRELVELMGEAGLGRDFLGFSNSRMAYDDVVARVCCTIENGTIQAKVTARTLADRYRHAKPFPKQVTSWCEEAIRALGSAVTHVETRRRFNKATLYSWLLFIPAARRAAHLSDQGLAGFISFFARLTDRTEDSLQLFVHYSLSEHQDVHAVADLLIDAYIDRSTARVADVTSVVLRDAVLWSALLAYLRAHNMPYDASNYRIALIPELLSEVTRDRHFSTNILRRILNDNRWGRIE